MVRSQVHVCECMFRALAVFTDSCAPQAMSDGVVKVSRRRESARKKAPCDLMCGMSTVAATLETARVCSLRPTAAEALVSLVGAWHAEYCAAGSDAQSEAVHALCGRAEPPP